MLKSFVLSLRFEQHRARRKRLCYWELSAILTVISNPPPQEAVAFDFPGQRAPKSDFVRRVQRLNLLTGLAPHYAAVRGGYILISTYPEQNNSANVCTDIKHNSTGRR